MASLTEELILILQNEMDTYESLLPIVEKKTRIIVNNDLQTLREITDKEQITVERIQSLERKREEIIKNMATVMNKKPNELNLKTLIKLLDKRPDEQLKLSRLHDSLTGIIRRLQVINDRNSSLIKQSLEMIEFNMNLIQSTRMAPGNSNYTRGASHFEMQDIRTGMFDAKQ